MSRTPIHPGEILGDELEELDMSAAELARAIKVPENRISQIIARKRNITADTSLRLGRWFGMSESFGLNVQKNYEIRKAVQELGSALDSIEPRQKAATA